jgi:nucleoside-diphosphate-sugar epimerase
MSKSESSKAAMAIPGSVVVLGANGRLGKALVAAFHAHGWRVRAMVRSRYHGPALPGLECVNGDALDEASVTESVRGFEVIVNALNRPFSDWAKTTPRITEVVISAARATSATVLLPGNIYHYGASMPALLSESTPALPSTPLGHIRWEMEQAYARSSSLNGFQTLILRAGDFFGRDAVASGGWFDSHITANFKRGKIMYPGPMDQLHAWAYLPDLARAMVALARQRKSLPKFYALGFPGYKLTGAELAQALETVAGRSLICTRVPWWMVRVGSWFSPQLRGVLQMRYLWNCGHVIDAKPFRLMLPDFVDTPLSVALSTSLS